MKTLKELVLEKLTKEDASKLNLLSFNMIKPDDSSSAKVIYPRNNAASSFYNSKDIQTGGFYKHTSLMIKPSDYEKF